MTASLQDSSQDSGRSQQCCHLDSLYSSADFQVLQALLQSFSYCAKCTNHNWHKRHFHVPQLFQFSSKVEVLIILFTFLQIYSVVRRDSKINNFANSLFLLIIIILFCCCCCCCSCYLMLP